MVVNFLIVIAIHLLTSTKKSFSASELQRPLGHSTYDPIWAMLDKLRRVMGLRDSKYKLEGVIELDEGFFSTKMEESEKDKPLKRGRGSQKKTKVLVMAESIPVETPLKKDDKPRKVNHIKMLVIEDLKASTIDEKVVEHVDENTIIDSDNSTSYTNFSSLVQEHRPKVIPKDYAVKKHHPLSNPNNTPSCLRLQL